MPQYFSVGSALVTKNELRDNAKKINRFYNDLSKNKTPDDVLLPTGVLSVETLNTPKQKGRKKPVPFDSIGLGTPLLIMICSIYTGNHPKSWTDPLPVNLDPRKGLLTTSSVKSFATYDAQPQAVNILKADVGRNSLISRPGADEVGTPIAFYSPALVDKSLTLTIRFIFDTFPSNVFTEIGKLLQGTAAIPVFLTQSPYLAAAGTIVNLIGTIGERVFDGKPAFETSVPIDVALPGEDPASAGFRLIFDEEVDRKTRNQYHVNKRGEVVDKDRKVFLGEIPYVVISCDGSTNDDLKSFIPTAASAEILSRFFGEKGSDGNSDLLLDALKVYNDVHFRKKVDALDAKIKNTSAAKQKAKLRKEREALVSNISSELLKPK
jgi:hypothetical protein